MTPILWAALILLGIVVAVSLLAVRVRRGQREDNTVVPGVETAAPSSWAGAHSPEARLHRRLRDAVRALRAASGPQDTFADLRAALEFEALAVDERLIAVAALPERVRAEPLRQVAAGVDAIEDAAAALATGMASGSTALPHVGDTVSERLRLLAEARAELEDPQPSVLPPLPAPPVAGTEGRDDGERHPGTS